MILNSNSWHASIYKKVYQVEELCPNLCGYFWKLLFALILFVPMCILYPIGYTKDDENDLQGNVVVAFIRIVYLILIVCNIYPYIYWFGNFNDGGLHFIGLFIHIISVCVFIIYANDASTDLESDFDWFVKWYEHLCPIIMWNDQKIYFYQPYKEMHGDEKVFDAKYVFSKRYVYKLGYRYRSSCIEYDPKKHIFVSEIKAKKLGLWKPA